jgi:hypothetical protein
VRVVAGLAGELARQRLGVHALVELRLEPQDFLRVAFGALAGLRARLRPVREG